MYQNYQKMKDSSKTINFVKNSHNYIHYSLKSTYFEIN